MVHKMLQRRIGFAAVILMPISNRNQKRTGQSEFCAAIRVPDQKPRILGKDRLADRRDTLLRLDRLCLNRRLPKEERTIRMDPKPLEFEVASIKPHAPGDTSSSTNLVSGGINATNVTLRQLIVRAYDIRIGPSTPSVPVAKPGAPYLAITIEH